jgi:thiol-disulfide isomerase/thioredoxin
MRSILLFIIVIFCLNTSNAQIDSAALYLQYPDLPLFSITRIPDSTKFIKADLPKKKPVVVVVFSPDCDHCKHETEALKANINLFKKAHILMVSHVDYDKIFQFYNDYRLSTYPNLTVGRDGSYLLGTFFNIHTYPAIFVYNKKLKLVKAFEGSVAIEKVALEL